MTLSLYHHHAGGLKLKKQKRPSPFSTIQSVLKRAWKMRLGPRGESIWLECPLLSNKLKTHSTLTAFAESRVQKQPDIGLDFLRNAKELFEIWARDFWSASLPGESRARELEGRIEKILQGSTFNEWWSSCTEKFSNCWLYFVVWSGWIFGSTNGICKFPLLKSE